MQNILIFNELLKVIDDAHATLPVDASGAASSIITRLQTSHVTDTEQRELAVQLISHLQTHINTYPKVQTIIAGGHIKYTENQSSIVKACLKALSKEYDIPLTPGLSITQVSSELAKSFALSIKQVLANPVATLTAALPLLSSMAAAIEHSYAVPNTSNDAHHGLQALVSQPESLSTQTDISTEPYIDEQSSMSWEQYTRDAHLLLPKMASPQIAYEVQTWLAEAESYTGPKPAQEQALEQAIERNDANAVRNLIAEVQPLWERFLKISAKPLHSKTKETYNNSLWINKKRKASPLASLYALEHNAVEVMKTLLEHGAYQNIGFIQANNSIGSLLSIAIQRNQVPMAELLIEYQCPLLAEYPQGSEVILQEIKLAIEYHVDIALLQKLIAYTSLKKPLDKTDNTFLMQYALNQNNINAAMFIVKNLEINASTDIIIENKVMSMLVFAIISNEPDAVIALLNQNASPFIMQPFKSSKEYTPIDIAAKILLATKNEDIPQQKVKVHNLIRIIQILHQHGAFITPQYLDRINEKFNITEEQLYQSDELNWSYENIIKILLSRQELDDIKYIGIDGLLMDRISQVIIYTLLEMLILHFLSHKKSPQKTAAKKNTSSEKPFKKKKKRKHKTENKPLAHKQPKEKVEAQLKLEHCQERYNTLKNQFEAFNKQQKEYSKLIKETKRKLEVLIKEKASKVEQADLLKTSLINDFRLFENIENDISTLTTAIETLRKTHVSEELITKTCESVKNIQQSVYALFKEFNTIVCPTKDTIFQQLITFEKDLTDPQNTEEQNFKIICDKFDTITCEKSETILQQLEDIETDFTELRKKLQRNLIVLKGDSLKNEDDEVQSLIEIVEKKYTACHDKLAKLLDNKIKAFNKNEQSIKIKEKQEIEKQQRQQAEQAAKQQRLEQRRLRRQTAKEAKKQAEEERKRKKERKREIAEKIDKSARLAQIIEPIKVQVKNNILLQRIQEQLTSLDAIYNDKTIGFTINPDSSKNQSQVISILKRNVLIYSLLKMFHAFGMLEKKYFSGLPNDINQHSDYHLYFNADSTAYTCYDLRNILRHSCYKIDTKKLNMLLAEIEENKQHFENAHAHLQADGCYHRLGESSPLNFANSMLATDEMKIDSMEQNDPLTQDEMVAGLEQSIADFKYLQTIYTRLNKKARSLVDNAILLNAMKGECIIFTEYMKRLHKKFPQVYNQISPQGPSFIEKITDEQICHAFDQEHPYWPRTKRQGDNAVYDDLTVENMEKIFTDIPIYESCINQLYASEQSYEVKRTHQRTSSPAVRCFWDSLDASPSTERKQETPESSPEPSKRKGL